MTVLIVDDSAVVRSRIVGLLHGLGKIRQIIEASDAKEGLERFREDRPDVIVLDIRMPEGNGIELLSQIKKERPSSLVIMLTNFPFPQYKQRCLDLGASYFFDKTSQLEELIGVLKTFVGPSLAS